MLSVIPAAVLAKLDVKPIGRREFKAFGGVVTREIGNILVGYDGARAGTTVIFGDDDDPPVLGVTALESLGYQVDPVTGRLNETEMLQL